MWKSFAGTFRDIPVAGLLALTSPGSGMSPLDLAAYHAPFPDERYQAGVRRFPQMVPVEPGMGIQIPPGTEHSLAVGSDAELKVVQFYTPSGPE